MANNYVVKDATGTNIVIESSEDTPGIQTPIHHIKTFPTDPFGASADAAVITDTGGTLSGKLRGLIKWAFERMPAALGQTTKANSLPVVLASDSDGMSIGASENFLGFTGKKVVAKTSTPTITASSAYTLGDCIGGLISITTLARVAAGSGKVLSAILADKAAQNVAIQLLLFDANPTSSTFTDKSAAVLDPSDLSKLVGSVLFSDFISVGTRSFCQVKADVDFALPSGTTMYAALVLQGAHGVPTYATTSDVIVKLFVEQD